MASPPLWRNLGEAKGLRRLPRWKVLWAAVGKRLELKKCELQIVGGLEVSL